MTGKSAFASQAGQDVFLWRNIFAKMTLNGQRGFYVESGANDASTASNTLFYDKCLG